MQEDKNILISKVLESNLPEVADAKNSNKLHITEKGGFYVYNQAGEKLQVGCSREEFENLKEAVEEQKMQWTDVEW